MVGALTDGRTDRQMDGRTLKISEGITYYPATFLVAGHNEEQIRTTQTPHMKPQMN